MKSIRRYLVAGILVWVPLAVTYLLIKFAVGIMDQTLKWIPKDYQPGILLQQVFGTEQPIHIPGLGVILTIVVLLLTGVLAANFVGRAFVGGWESLMERIPVVRSIYSAAKNFAEIVFSDSSRSFKNVLLIEYPRKGIYSLAFQTSEYRSRREEIELEMSERHEEAMSELGAKAREQGIDYEVTTYGIDDLDRALAELESAFRFNDAVLRLWRHNGNGQPMTDIAVDSGVIAVGETRGVVVFDYDRDGDQDFYVVSSNRQPFLFENRSTDLGHWLRVKVRGTQSNRDGVGAIVRLTTADGRVQMRMVGNNSNYNSHNEPVVHFGLGEATEVTELEIEWPVSGWVQRFTDLPADQVLSVEEPDDPVVTPPQGSPTRGMYWDRSRSGHGFDLQRIGENWFFLMYTYHPDNTPLWYLATGEVKDGVFAGTASQFDFDPGRSPPQRAIADTGGPIRIDFGAASEPGDHACNDGVDRDSALSTALFDFDLDGQQGQWCVEPFVFANDRPTPDFTGSWYNSEDVGWGLTIVTQGNGGDETLMVVLYYYDAEQQPRWALGSASGVDFGSEISVEMLQFSGFCLNCAPGAVEPTAVGTVRLTLAAPSLSLDAGNVVDVDVEFSGAPGGSWQKTDAPIQLLSDPAE